MLYQTEDLPALARAARKGKRLTQAEAAKVLGVTQTSISQAERDGTGPMVALQTRMLETFAGKRVAGPLWRVE